MNGLRASEVAKPPEENAANLQCSVPCLNHPLPKTLCSACKIEVFLDSPDAAVTSSVAQPYQVVCKLKLLRAKKSLHQRKRRLALRIGSLLEAGTLAASKILLHPLGWVRWLELFARFVQSVSPTGFLHTFIASGTGNCNCNHLDLHNQKSNIVTRIENYLHPFW